MFQFVTIVTLVDTRAGAVIFFAGSESTVAPLLFEFDSFIAQFACIGQADSTDVTAQIELEGD
jgi:hypothetical protein